MACTSMDFQVLELSYVRTFSPDQLVRLRNRSSFGSLPEQANERERNKQWISIGERMPAADLQALGWQDGQPASRGLPLFPFWAFHFILLSLRAVVGVRNVRRIFRFKERQISGQRVSDAS